MVTGAVSPLRVTDEPLAGPLVTIDYYYIFNVIDIIIIIFFIIVFFSIVIVEQSFGRASALTTKYQKQTKM